MKLNLVPTYVSKERQGRTAYVGAAFFIILGVVASVLLTKSSHDQLVQARQDNDDAKPKAAAANDTSAQADTIIAANAQIFKNTNLAKAMIDHNDVYPDFYTNEIFPYIPPFFRLTSISASPVDASTSTVTMVGTLKSFQQYADLVLALMRIKGAVSVGRNGFSGDQFFVPPITQDDQIGKYRKTTEPPIPDDPLQRLAYYQAQATPPQGYVGQGNFGSGTTDERGATPDESLVTITLTVSKDLRTPDPRATLRTSTAGPASTGLGAPSTGFGGPSGAPPGIPGPGSGAARGRGGAGGGD